MAGEMEPDAGEATVEVLEVLRRWSLEEPFPLPEADFGAILDSVDFLRFGDKHEEKTHKITKNTHCI